MDKQKTRMNTVNLLTSTIKAGAEEEGLRHCFRVVSPEREYLLQVRQPYYRHGQSWIVMNRCNDSVWPPQQQQQQLNEFEVEQ